MRNLFLYEHGLRSNDLFEEESDSTNPAFEAESEEESEDSDRNSVGNAIGNSGTGDHQDLNTRRSASLWNVLPFYLSEHGFDHLTTKSHNMNNTFLRFVKIMEEFVFGLEVFLKCVENIVILFRKVKLNPKDHH